MPVTINSDCYTLISASDIRLLPHSTSKDMLMHSREVIDTNGEWDLADISVNHVTLGHYDTSYSVIRINVRTFFGT